MKSNMNLTEYFRQYSRINLPDIIYDPRYCNPDNHCYNKVPIEEPTLEDPETYDYIWRPPLVGETLTEFRIIYEYYGYIHALNGDPSLVLKHKTDGTYIYLSDILQTKFGMSSSDYFLDHMDELKLLKDVVFPKNYINTELFRDEYSDPNLAIYYYDIDLTSELADYEVSNDLNRILVKDTSFVNLPYRLLNPRSLYILSSSYVSGIRQIFEYMCDSGNNFNITSKLLGTEDALIISSYGSTEILVHEVLSLEFDIHPISDSTKTLHIKFTTLSSSPNLSVFRIEGTDGDAVFRLYYLLSNSTSGFTFPEFYKLNSNWYKIYRGIDHVGIMEYYIAFNEPFEVDNIVYQQSPEACP